MVACTKNGMGHSVPESMVPSYSRGLRLESDARHQDSGSASGGAITRCGKIDLEEGEHSRKGKTFPKKGKSFPKRTNGGRQTKRPPDHGLLSAVSWLLVRVVLLVAKGLEIADEIIFHAFPFVWVGHPLLNDFLCSRKVSFDVFLCGIEGRL